MECISGGHGELFDPEKQHKLVCPRAEVTVIMLPSAFNQDHGFLNIDFQSQEKKGSGRRRRWGLRKAGESGALGTRALQQQGGGPGKSWEELCAHTFSSLLVFFVADEETS